MEIKAKKKTRRRSIIEADRDLEEKENGQDYFQLLSLEIICKIFRYVSLFDVLKLSSQCRKFQQAVSMYLRILKSIDFTQGQLHGWMPATVNDDHLNSLLPKCRELEYIYGFHPPHLSKRRLRNCRHTLSIPGILAALNFAANLKGIEISDITLLSAVLNYFPNLKILGLFRNRMTESAIENDRFSFTVNPKVTSLHLTGITIPCLPKMDIVQFLYLHQVKITNAHPFREFLVPKLQTFVMSNCCGPVNALSYVPLFAGLAAAQPLTRLELVKVPFMGGLIHHIVEDRWRANGFRQLTNVLFSSCRNALEMDLGFLLITAADKIKELSIQPSLTKDSLFSALNMADVQFDNLKVLSLGYVDVALEQGDVAAYELGSSVIESPAMITDNGMKAVGQTFQDIAQLELYNCPHLIQPCTWFSSVVVNWAYLQHLTLRRCHSVRLQDFSTFISHLPRLEMLQLEYMFREPPKGCSRVGLSAGTGLGVSSALVQNHAHGNDIQPNQPADDEQEVDDEDDLNNNDGEEMNRAEEPEDDENMEIVPIIMLNNARAAPIRNRQIVSDADGAEVNMAEPPPLPVEQPPLPAEPPVVENPPLPEDNLDENNMEASQTEEKKTNNVESDITLPSCSHGNSSSSGHGQSEVVHDVNEPGCSHWNYGKEPEENSKQSKTSDSSKVKKSSKSSGSIRDNRVKSVRIVSVKCSPPARSTRSSTNASQELSADTNTISGNKETNADHNMVGGRFEVQGDPVENNNIDSSCYLYDKPPPKYSEALGAGNSGASCSGLKYQNDNQDDNNCAEPMDVESPNSNLCDMNVSPPDYETAMAQGNVINVPPCSCGLKQNTDNANNSSAEKPVDDNKDVVDTGNQDTGKNDNESLNNSEKKCPKDENEKPQKLKRKNKSAMERLGLETFSCDQACQAVSEEIREETQKAEEKHKSQKKKKTGTTGSTRKSSSRQISKKNQNGSSSKEGQKLTSRSRRSSVSLKRKTSIHHKATSTSDPVLEDDHIQVLLLRSDSLICVKLHMVGITDLIIEDCPELSSVSGSACRVLKKVTIYSAPHLSKTNFAQCKKLDQTHLVNEVCDQISEHDRVIFLRPMHQFCLRDFEAMLFQQPDICYYIGVIYDYSPCPNQTLYNRVRVTNWLELFSRLNVDFVRCMDFVETSWYRVDANKYPWKRDIYRMQGYNENGSKWEMITDIPWIRMLSQCPDIKHHNQVADDFKAGVYCQGAKGHFNKEDARDGITLELAEFQDANQTFFLNNIIVYFNMCDISGVPTPDFYL